MSRPPPAPDGNRRGAIRYRFEGELGWWAQNRGVSFDRLIRDLLEERSS
jgi:hypothetical protein